jgi:hypothetical protein
VTQGVSLTRDEARRIADAIVAIGTPIVAILGWKPPLSWLTLFKRKAQGGPH